MEHKIKLAFADDHQAIRQAIIAMLNCDSIECVADAENGRALIDKITKLKNSPDVCLLDISMPVLNGYETLIELKERWPSIKVLVFTALGSDQNIIRMIRHGAQGYIMKNADIADVRKAIIEVYKEGIYYSDRVPQRLYSSIMNGEIPVQNLTAREMQLLQRCCSDSSYAEIAKELGVTTRSVEGWRDSIFRKLNVASRVSLAMFAIEHGMVPLEIAPYRDAVIQEVGRGRPVGTHK